MGFNSGFKGLINRCMELLKFFVQFKLVFLLCVFEVYTSLRAEIIVEKRFAELMSPCKRTALPGSSRIPKGSSKTYASTCFFFV